MAAYLLEHPNPNAPVRADGGRYWGHPTRQRPIDTIVVHTAENVPDWGDTNDLGAENVAAYAARMERAASYHTVVDSDTTIELLPAGYTAFHARGWNSNSLGLSFATSADQWDDAPEWWVASILANGADVAAGWCQQFGIDPVRVTKGVIYQGGTGFVAHADVDPSRRHDPGTGFPWDRFLTMVAERLPGAVTAPAPSALFSGGPVPIIDLKGAPGGGEWALIEDGGVMNFGGAPYCGHLLDPATRQILTAALGIGDGDLYYDGKPYSIEANDLGGYDIWTDRNRRYSFHPGTV